jgi:hypothetical protein
MLSAVGRPCAVNPDSDLREYAKEQGWEIYDFRTGRKVTMVALPAAAGAGALAGGVAAGIALRRRYRVAEPMSMLDDLHPARLSSRIPTLGRRSDQGVLRPLRWPARRR